MSDTSDKNSKEHKPDFDELQFIRVFTPQHVPKYLIEQVKHRHYDVEEWYAYLEAVCRKSDGSLNPFCLLYVISDADYKVIGTLWCEIHPLEKSLIIQTYSMDNEYWNAKGAIKFLAKKAKEIAKECKLKAVYWVTRHPKTCEKYGFKRSRDVLMEYEGEEDGKEFNGEHLDGQLSNAESE